MAFSGGYKNQPESWQNVETIPVNQTRGRGTVEYKSAIALKLAPLWQQSAIDIATELAKCWMDIVNTEADGDAGNFQVELISSGIIFFKITDLSIAKWLDDLSSADLIIGPENLPVSINSRSVTSTTLFNIQYSHARCCSLLRMGESDRLITVTLKPENETQNSIPWQQENEKLQFSNDAEYELIYQIAFTLDRIYCISESQKVVTWEKVANKLSAAFQNFYSGCRIWGEVKVETPKLAQARLGLVLVTRSILRFLLEKRLSSEAPVEF
ncbi:MAG: DALR anticodon-binding domain-containing protein [Microcoleaceae cyanobacterium MO_207.B10]|nr:DALR anticodon-binding domain-containing protein [Microcoleaceae cyanobacterium MO_207.B10]